MVHAVSGEIEEYRDSRSFVAMPKPVRIGRLRPVRVMDLESVYDSDLMEQVGELEQEIGILQEDVTEEQLSSMVSETVKYFPKTDKCRSLFDKYFSGAANKKSIVDLRSDDESANLQNRRDLMNAGFEYFTESHSWVRAKEIVDFWKPLGYAIVVTNRYDPKTRKQEPGTVDLFYKLPELKN